MNHKQFTNHTVEIGSATVRLGSMLGSGKEGSIYSLQDSDERVVKIFKSDLRNSKENKVKSMVRNRPPDPTAKDTGRPSLVWPIKAVHSQSQIGGDFLGYVMPLIDTDEYRDAQKYAREELKRSNSSAEFRYTTALNLTLTVTLLHLNDHAIGDMNHQNVLVNEGMVSLIDCDGFHFSGKYEEFPGDTIHHRYAPPDGRGDENGLKGVQYADRFGLAIHIFQFLMSGFHPFATCGCRATEGSKQEKIKRDRFPYVDPKPGVLEPSNHAPEYSSIPTDIRDLFERAFVYGKSAPRNRPSATEWARTLAKHTRVDIEGLGDSESDTLVTDKWEQKRKERRQYRNSADGIQNSDGSKADKSPRQNKQDGNWVNNIRKFKSSGDFQSGDFSITNRKGATTTKSSHSSSTTSSNSNQGSSTTTTSRDSTSSSNTDVSIGTPLNSSKSVPGYSSNSASISTTSPSSVDKNTLTIKDRLIGSGILILCGAGSGVLYISLIYIFTSINEFLSMIFGWAVVFDLFNIAVVSNLVVFTSLLYNQHLKGIGKFVILFISAYIIVVDISQPFINIDPFGIGEIVFFGALLTSVLVAYQEI